MSNFDLADMQQLWSLPGGDATASDQVLYNLTRRGIEWDLLPWCRAQRLPIMAYSPIEQGRLASNRALRGLAEGRGVTPAQLALAAVLHQDGVIAIPKASNADHVRQNRAALDIALGADELVALDKAFPPPSGPQPLAML